VPHVISIYRDQIIADSDVEESPGDARGLIAPHPGKESGLPGEIRTPDPRLRRPTL
jgi:hypothetical protein